MLGLRLELGFRLYECLFVCPTMHEAIAVCIVVYSGRS